MTTRDFTANVISASKVVPDGNFKDSKASGVWDINEALDLIKGGNWPNVANLNPASFVDGLFQTHLYDGTGSQQTITNNIDFTKGGLIITKRRDSTTGNGPYWNDTERGVNNYVRSDSDGGNGAQNTSSTGAVVSTSSTGYVVGTFNGWNNSSGEYVSWSFRKQPKFFDVVTYTGTGSVQNISHNLGSVPGMILIKDYSASNAWAVYHRGVDSSAPEDYALNLAATSARDDATAYFNDTAPTSSVFTVGTTARTNNNGSTYVAYLFAHNDGDGGFGESADQDIIKCGRYSGSGTHFAPEQDIGFEPQWLLVKTATGTKDWVLFDNMRGLSVDGSHDSWIYPNTNGADNSPGSLIELKPTGFKPNGSSFTGTSGKDFIYVAIRRGGTITPTAASDVFAMDNSANSSAPYYTSGFPVDFSLYKRLTEAQGWSAGSRITGAVELATDSNSEEVDQSNNTYDFMTGFRGGSNADGMAWMWKRARGYFDVTTWKGTGSATTVTHNLGAVPEMMWIKMRNDSQNWAVYHKGANGGTDPEDYGLELNSTSAEFNTATYFNDTAPTSSVFTVGTGNAVNQSNKYYIAYLFATVAGVSKVGSYTGTGSSQNIDCGFTAGSSFVLVKRYDGVDSWYIADSARGISSGQTDKIIKLNSTDAQFTESDASADYIAPHASGFNVPANSPFNGSGDDFIFYAIAAIS